MANCFLQRWRYHVIIWIVIGTSKFLEYQGIQNSLADHKMDIKKNLIKTCTSHYGFRLGFFVSEFFFTNLYIII